MRFRSDKRWNTPFIDHESPEIFMENPVTAGAHTVLWRGQPLDLLVVDRGAAVTLVTFNGAVSLKIQSYPLFTGLGLAEETAVNLVAVSDPTLLASDLTVAWYLGNTETGPIDEIYASLIQHVLSSLNTKRTILFGVSGGGYAAARMGHHFPNCVTLLVNPRLSLLEYSAVPLALYFKHAHDKEVTNPLADEDLRLLEKFGPGRYRLDKNQPLKHDLLIYQNLIDQKFMSTQVLPFLKASQSDPRLHLRFEADELGHTPIPSETIRSIIGELTADVSQGDAIQSAGFSGMESATFDALYKFQSVAARLMGARQQEQALQKRIEELSQAPSPSVI